MNDENNKDEKNILKKIMDTIRTESRDLTEAVMGTYGMGKIEQEFDSAQFKIKEAKLALTQMMKKQRQSSHLLGITIEKINQQELLITQALEINDKDKALQHALEVVNLENQHNMQSETIDSISEKVHYLQSQLEHSERELKEVSRQLNMLKTNDKIQKATETIMSNIDKAETNMTSARQSIERLKNKQLSKDTIFNTQEPLINKHQKSDVKNTPRLTEIEDVNTQAQKVLNRLKDKEK